MYETIVLMLLSTNHNSDATLMKYKIAKAFQSQENYDNLCAILLHLQYTNTKLAIALWFILFKWVTIFTLFTFTHVGEYLLKILQCVGIVTKLARNNNRVWRYQLGHDI